MLLIIMFSSHDPTNIHNKGKFIKLIFNQLPKRRFYDKVNYLYCFLNKTQTETYTDKFKERIQSL